MSESGDDKDKLEEAMKKLNDAIMPIGAKMYQAASDDKKSDDDKKDDKKDDDGAVEGEVVDK
jgi:molecular chaperone DnaK